MKRQSALRAGVTTYAVTAIILATLVLPWVAHIDFGHFHPDHTPTHVHTLSSLFQAGATGSSPSLEAAAPGHVVDHLSSRTIVVSTLSSYPVGSRAPPLLSSFL